MPDVPTFASRAEWFQIVMSYLEVKSLVLWLQLHPESTYEQFEIAWPFLLDQMMVSATGAAIKHLQTTVQTTDN